MDLGGGYGRPPYIVEYRPNSRRIAVMEDWSACLLLCRVHAIMAGRCAMAV